MRSGTGDSHRLVVSGVMHKAMFPLGLSHWTDVGPRIFTPLLRGRASKQVEAVRGATIPSAC